LFSFPALKINKGEISEYRTGDELSSQQEVLAFFPLKKNAKIRVHRALYMALHLTRKYDLALSYPQTRTSDIERFLQLEEKRDGHIERCEELGYPALKDLLTSIEAVVPATATNDRGFVYVSSAWVVVKKIKKNQPMIDLFTEKQQNHLAKRNAAQDVEKATDTTT
jgi:hypothetical protein